MVASLNLLKVVLPWNNSQTNTTICISQSELTENQRIFTNNFHQELVRDEVRRAMRNMKSPGKSF